jgi:hypothetical protein
MDVFEQLQFNITFLMLPLLLLLAANLLACLMADLAASLCQACQLVPLMQLRCWTRQGTRKPHLLAKAAKAAWGRSCTSFHPSPVACWVCSRGEKPVQYTSCFKQLHDDNVCVDGGWPVCVSGVFKLHAAHGRAWYMFESHT